MAVAVLSVWTGLIVAFVFFTAGCFSPRQPACAFSCAADGVCPAGYSCQDDGVCHRDDGQGTCDIPAQISDAAQDAVGGAVDGDGGGG
jgi:hypothetical protein